jgi:hypothetical protein
MTREKKITRKDTQLNRDPSSFNRRGNRLSGDDPMTPAQEHYLEQLSEDAGKSLDQSLTRSQASKRIDALKAKRK